MGPSKVFGVTVCCLILTIQVVEALQWREDYPFTKWGMYHSFHSFSPYINVEIDISGDLGSESTLLKNPWTVRERIWSLLGIGAPTDPIDQDIEIYLARVKEKSEINHDKIKQILLSSLWEPEHINNVSVTFLAWKNLNHTNTKTPDIRYPIFPGNP